MTKKLPAKNYSKTYTILGSLIILMIWIYIVSKIILFGAEVNSECEMMRQASSSLDY